MGSGKESIKTPSSLHLRYLICLEHLIKPFLLSESKISIKDKLFSAPLCQDMSHIFYIGSTHWAYLLYWI